MVGGDDEGWSFFWGVSDGIGEGRPHPTPHHDGRHAGREIDTHPTDPPPQHTSCPYLHTCWREAWDVRRRTAKALASSYSPIHSAAVNDIVIWWVLCVGVWIEREHDTRGGGRLLPWLLLSSCSLSCKTAAAPGGCGGRDGMHPCLPACPPPCRESVCVFVKGCRWSVDVGRSVGSFGLRTCMLRARVTKSGVRSNRRREHCSSKQPSSRRRRSERHLTSSLCLWPAWILIQKPKKGPTVVAPAACWRCCVWWEPPRQARGARLRDRSIVPPRERRTKERKADRLLVVAMESHTTHNCSWATDATALCPPNPPLPTLTNTNPIHWPTHQRQRKKQAGRMARCVALVRGAPGTETELQVAGVVRFEQVRRIYYTCDCDGV